ncbi:hypothetical protein ACKW6Q_09160 [Chryseobacterium kwangjuense]|uniref:Response regulatory domain-containing protein n=1 Tax=Chryseobacterium kwangjuense TaxID=267125 RepID=A0ABW9K339_9FLAO
MYNLGLIDDRETSREALKLSIKRPMIGKGWDVIDTPPFAEVSDYINWINENEISVIVIDEKLNDQATSCLGHDVVKYLKTFFNDIPIFCITAYPREENLNSVYDLYYLIISKSDFEAKRDEYVNLMIKSGEDFYKEFNDKKNKISELSIKKANNEIIAGEEKELSNLQEFIKNHFGSDNNETLDSWLQEFSQGIKDYELIAEEIKKHITDDLGENC